MKKLLPLFLLTSFGLGVQAQTTSTVTIAQLPNIGTVNTGTVNPTDIFYDLQQGTLSTYATAAQLKTYFSSSSQPLSSTLTSFAGGDPFTWGTGLTTSGTYPNLSIEVTPGLYEPALGVPATSGYVLSSTAAGVRSWVPNGASSLTIGSNAAGIITVSSGVINLAQPVNGASGLVQLDGTGNIPAGLLGNYIGSTVQTYSSALTTLGAGDPFTPGNGIAISGTWPNVTIALNPAASINWTGSQTFTNASGTFTGTFNGLAISSTTGTLNIGAGAYLGATGSITLAGSGPLNIGTGGTLGSAAYQNSSAFQTALTLTTTGTGPATLSGNTLNIPATGASYITALTTTGTSGAASVNAGTLNIPQYQGGVTSFNTRSGAITLTASDINATGTINVTNTGPSSYATTSGTATALSGTITASQVTGLSSTAITGTATALSGTITASQVTGLSSTATTGTATALSGTITASQVAGLSSTATTGTATALSGTITVSQVAGLSSTATTGTATAISGGIDVPPLSYPAPTIIVDDADANGDSDDYFAEDFLIGAMARGEAKVLCVATDDLDTTPAPAIAICYNYSGFGYVPIGACQTGTFASSSLTYSNAITSAFASVWAGGTSGTTAPSTYSSVTVERTALVRAMSQYGPKSITYFSHGSLQALYALLQSAADSVSSMTGTQLFSAAVTKVVIMGGHQTTGTEANLDANPADSAAAVSSIHAMTPTLPIWWVPYEIESSITGTNTCAPGSPMGVVRNVDSSPPPWDCWAAMIAVRGLSYLGHTYVTATQGTQVINSSTGANTFTAGAGSDYMIAYATGGQTQMQADYDVVFNASPMSEAQGQGVQNLTAPPQYTYASSVTSPGAGSYLLCPSLANNTPNEVEIGRDGNPNDAGFFCFYNVSPGSASNCLNLFAYGKYAGTGGLSVFTGNNDVGINMGHTDNGFALEVGGTTRIDGLLTASAGITETGTVTAAGPVAINSTQTTVAASTSGTVTFSEPATGNALKLVIAHCSAATGTASYTFPTAFTTTPTEIDGLNLFTSIGTGTATLTGTTTTANAILMGY